MLEETSKPNIKEIEGKEVTDAVNELSSRILTTEEEIEGYYIVKSILRATIDPKRIVMRDKKNDCGILLDDNNKNLYAGFISIPDRDTLSCSPMKIEKQKKLL